MISIIFQLYLPPPCVFESEKNLSRWSQAHDVAVIRQMKYFVNFEKAPTKLMSAGSSMNSEDNTLNWIENCVVAINYKIYFIKIFKIHDKALNANPPRANVVFIVQSIIFSENKIIIVCFIL